MVVGDRKVLKCFCNASRDTSGLHQGGAGSMMETNQTAVVQAAEAFSRFALDSVAQWLQCKSEARSMMVSCEHLEADWPRGQADVLRLRTLPHTCARVVWYIPVCLIEFIIQNYEARKRCCIVLVVVLRVNDSILRR